MKASALAVCGLLAVSFAATTYADTLNVPGDYATINAALAAAQDNDTILIAAGTYNEGLDITKSVIIEGATGDPADVIIKPNDLNDLTAVSFGSGDRRAIINVGDASGAGAIDYDVEIRNVTINGDRLRGHAQSLSRYYGIFTWPFDGATDPASLTVDNCVIEGIRLHGFGAQSPACIYALGNDLTVTDTRFEDLGKGGIVYYGDYLNGGGSPIDGGGPYEVLVDGCTIIGTDPREEPSPTQQSQNLFQFYSGTYFGGSYGPLNVVATITNNDFSEQGPSGGPRGLYAWDYDYDASNENFVGYAHVAKDTTTGACLLYYPDSATTLTLTGNTFTNNQTIIQQYPDADGRTVNSLVTNNTVNVGKWYTWGDPDFDSYVYLYGPDDSDPNFLNYMLYYAGGDDVTVGPSTYNIATDMLDPGTTTTINSPNGPATINVQGTVPSNVFAGTNVTINAGYTGFPDTDGDGVLDVEELAIYESDPNNRDTDGDGFEDGTEVVLRMAEIDAKKAAEDADPGGYNFTTTQMYHPAFNDDSALGDVDGDGVPDNVDPNTGEADTDGDGYSDFYELTVGTSLTDPSDKPALGDVTDDGTLEFGDGLLVLQDFLGLTTITPANVRDRGDVNRDYNIDNVDGVILINLFLGNVSSIPIP